MSDETMICPECGNVISPKQRMCHNCGFPIEQVKNQSSVQSIAHELEKRKCPECGSEIGGNPKMCPSCGFPLGKEGQEEKCPECGNAVASTDSKCSSCGYPLSGTQNKTNTKIQIHKGVLVASLLISLVFFALGIRQLNDPKIDFYIGHIEECEAGIADAEWDKKDTLVTLVSHYDYIIESYEDLIEDDKQKLRDLRLKGYFFIGIGAAIIIGMSVYAIRSNKEK